MDTGVTHLVPNVCCGLAIGDQLAREEMPEVVVSRARHTGALSNRLPDVSLKMIGVNETMAVAREHKCRIGITCLQIGQ